MFSRPDQMQFLIDLSRRDSLIRVPNFSRCATPVLLVHSLEYLGVTTGSYARVVEISSLIGHVTQQAEYIVRELKLQI